ncbi:MAG: pyruvate formate lyase family protein [Bacillota bacterium]|nr:pyruvate formate lyase family protein [Bacillota bacterium]
MTRHDRLEVLLKTLSSVGRITPPGGEAGRPSVLDEPGAAASPVAIRKARALAWLLRNVPVHIYPGELIVGLPFRELPGDPGVQGEAASESGVGEAAGGEAAARLLPPGGAAGEGYILEARRRLAGGWPLEPYSPDIFGIPAAGAGTRYGLLPRFATDQELHEAARVGLDENSNPGHLQAGHARVLAHGWSGLREMAAAKLAALDETTEIGAGRAAFLRSVLIVLDAARDFALRYADLAETQAGAAADPARRAELLQIAAVCRHLADAPPSTFWEALQLHYFTHLIAMNQGARQMGRFDQYMYPFLAADLDAGRLTMDRAAELLDCLWVKYNQLTDITVDNLQNMILGGQDQDGGDATNLLSHMCLDATDRLGLVDPKLSVRLHRGTPEGFVRRTAEIIAAGRYQPGVYNDEAIIPALVGAGIPLEHARDYSNDGCSELLIQGRTNPWCFEAKVHLLQCLERTVRRLEDFATFDDLFSALKGEINRAVEMALANANLLQVAAPRISPNPLVSATVEGCLERMLDLTEGGALYNPAGLCASGVADTADGLAALRRMIYVERAVAAGDLVRALATDFDGEERMRQALLNRAPKFGNDSDEVDDLVVALVQHMAGRVRGRVNPRGGEYVLGLFSYGDYIGHGLMTGATPDGRRRGGGISPNFSPAPGRDLEGPFAVLQSTAKVPPALTPNGRAVDIALHPSAVSGPDGVANMAGLLRAFVEVGEMQVQFNVLDGKVLREAQRDPERYRNLTVRLWGFPAYFVRLPREFQEHLIARTAGR